MNPYALLHITDSAYAFPVSAHELVLRLRTAKDDIKRAYVCYESKYVIGRMHRKKEMQKILSGALFDWYDVHLTLTDTRLAYVFYLDDGEQQRYFSEEGLTREYDYTKGYYNFFQYPYIHASELLPKTNWLSEAVFYQIFVDRFRIGKTNKDRSYINLRWGELPNPKSFAGGDLAGITEKLSYIRRLGCNALYLTPIFSSVSNHKYDIRDYRTIDPQFGTAEELKHLVDTAHDMGMRVVLDAVFNHCSEQLREFEDVKRRGRQSPYFDWFVIRGDAPEKEPLNYEVFAACAYMPKWNTANPAVQQYLIDIATYYIREFDIDGWRLDVSDEIGHDFWRSFRKAVKREKPDAVIIGENWHDASAYLHGDQYDSIMNYAFTKCMLDYFAHGKADAKGLAGRLSELLARNSDTANDMMLNLLDSHDTDRFFSEIKEDKRKLHAALALLYLYPGEPSVYYGTEVYLPGGYDPDNRRCMDWDAAETGECKELTALLQRLAAIREQAGLHFAGTRLHTSADGRLFCMERVGAGARVTYYSNETDEAGRDGEVTVPPGGFRIFINGKEG